MMKDKHIIIDIDSEGNVTAETFNMEGIHCVDELNQLMKDIASIQEDQKKPDFYKEARTSQKKVVVQK